MKRLILLSVFGIVTLLLAIKLKAIPVAAQTDTPTGPAIACLPGVYFDDPGDCFPSGPSAYRTQMAQKGITLPITQLPASKPDFALTNTDIRYGQVRTRNAPVYGSMEDALQNNKKQAIRRVDSSFSYVSYSEDAVVEGKRVYQVEPGAWMTAVDISRIGAVPLFQGLTFSQTPERPFGWILAYLSPGPVETKRTPGYQTNDYTGHLINNHETVWVFDEQTIGDASGDRTSDGDRTSVWYMVAPDEWLPGNVVARVLPNPIPPKGVTGDRWIEVNLHEQTLAVYDQHRLVFATLIASGLEPFWTRPGLFQIFQKLETTPMRGSFEADRSDAYYLEDVPWTMYFDGARALHGAYWRANLGFPQSHGCVNLSVGDAHWLFDWAKDGDWVYVWDPSGKTPTDPDIYKAGGY